jgi:hypothetical protein
MFYNVSTKCLTFDKFILLVNPRVLLLEFLKKIINFVWLSLEETFFFRGVKIEIQLTNMMPKNFMEFHFWNFCHITLNIYAIRI